MIEKRGLMVFDANDRSSDWAPIGGRAGSGQAGSRCRKIRAELHVVELGGPGAGLLADTDH